MSVETVQSEQGATNTQSFDNQAAFERNANMAEQLKQGAPDALKQLGAMPSGGGRQDSALDYVGADAVASGSKYSMAIKSAATVWDQARSPGGGITGDLGRSKQSRFMPSNGHRDDMKEINAQRRAMSKQARSRAGKADILERANIAGDSLTGHAPVGMSIPSKFVAALGAAAAYIGTVIKKIHNNMETALENIKAPSLQRIVEDLGRGFSTAEEFMRGITPDLQRQMEVGKSQSFLAQQANQTNDVFVDRNTGGLKTAPNAPSAPSPSGQSK
ncbi:MAG: hypothetical protein Q8K65_12530 [Alphaproteobacteria bacterium]|nr:hypothetical protein [Alphaproteobacteria bacterium]